MAAALAIAVGSCGGGVTGPPPAVAVTLAVTANVGPQTLTDSTGNPYLRCGVNVTATARGPASARGTWGEAIFTWYAGVDTSAAIFVDTVPASTVQQAWHGQTIRGGETETATWSISGGLPFTVHVVQFYVTGAQADLTAGYSAYCGPSVPAGGATPPSVGSVSLDSAASALRPGGTLAVRYSASAAAGLWETIVLTAGALRAQHVTAEYFTTSTARVDSIALPDTTPLDSPIDVAVVAVDGLAHVAGAQLASPVMLPDTSPPHIQLAASGQYAAGDTIPIGITATDNRGVASVILSVGPPASVTDTVSLLLADSSWSRVRVDTVGLVVQSGWVGTPQIVATVRDVSGLASAPDTAPPNAVRIYPQVAHPVSTVSVPGGIRDVALDAPRGVLYLSQPDSQRVAVVSLTLAAAEAPIALPAAPHGIDVSRGGDSLFAVLPDRMGVAVIALGQSGSSPKMIPVAIPDTAPPHLYPDNLRVDSTGRMIITLADSTLRNGRLLELDPVTGGDRLVTAAGYYNNSDIEPANVTLARTMDRSNVIVDAIRYACVRDFDAARDTLFACNAVNNDAGVIAADSTGQRYLFGPETRGAQLAYGVTFLVVGYNGSTSGVSPDGRLAYISARRGIVTGRVSDQVLLERMTVPFVAHQILVTPNGDTLVGTATDSSGVGHVEIVDLTRLATPTRVATAPSRKLLMLGESGATTVRRVEWRSSHAAALERTGARALARLLRWRAIPVPRRAGGGSGR